MRSEGRPPYFDSGDRVVACNNLGGFVRARVPRGTAGVVTSRSADGSLAVRFDNGRQLWLDPIDVRAPTVHDNP